MGYRVEYESEDLRKRPQKRGRKFVFTAICFCLFCWLVSVFWPEGVQLMKILLIPGDPDATIAAAEVFAGELACGIPMIDAAKNFCQVVLSNGYSG